MGEEPGNSNGKIGMAVLYCRRRKLVEAKGTPAGVVVKRAEGQRWMQAVYVYALQTHCYAMDGYATRRKGNIKGPFTPTLREARSNKC